MSEAKTKVIIVGAGIFGMSTALWMLEDGGYDVTILDKCGILPAPDAASTDLNKIIRAGDYADPLLSKLSIEAIDHWRKAEWENTYHESGVICLSSSSDAQGQKYVSSSYRNCLSFGLAAKLTPNPESIKQYFPKEVTTGEFGNKEGYSNPIGGWAEAGRAVEVGLARVRLGGGTVRAGCEVVGLILDGKKVNGVILEGGEEIKADLVVVAAGAWTPKLFASPQVSARLPPIVATGQSVAMVQLTPEEIESYSKNPVVFNLDDGFYVFPPNPHGIVKMAIHAAGYTNPTSCSTSSEDVSVPRTKLTPGAEDGMIPTKMVGELRAGLNRIYPELAKKEFVSTRLCWYCDTVTGDWLIDYHPDFENLVVATGGSGHAFKFAPIIGREILSIIKRNHTSAALADRWSFNPTSEAGADVRIGERQVLKVEELATVNDLKPTQTAVLA